MSYSVSSELYREVALHLSEAIGSGSYFSGTLAFAWGEAECRLTLSVIVYRRRISAPDGQADIISHLVPVWWNSTPYSTASSNSTTSPLRNSTPGSEALVRRIAAPRSMLPELSGVFLRLVLPGCGAARRRNPEQEPPRRGATHRVRQKIPIR